jgi:hypothetical protein
MSVETSRTNQPGDGDPDDEHTFGYRSADSAAADDDLEDDDLDGGPVVSRDDEDDLDGDDATVVHGTVYDSSAADYGTAGSDAAVTDVDDPQPTFTPVDDGTVDDGTVDDGTVDDSSVSDVPDAGAPTLSETDGVPVVPVSNTAVTEAPLSSATDLDPNAPLLGDSVNLRASWQQAQAGFVDDPRTAVSDAAELVEHAAQTLIGSLQQRQRALRTQWDNNGSDAASPSTTGQLSDTEQLRHLMQDYRNLFNQLVQP